MKFSRRRFLTKTLTGATLIASGQLNLSALCKASAEADSPPFSSNSKPADARINLSKSSKDLLEKLSFKGRVVTPDDSDYFEAREDYNGRFDSHPKAVLYCNDENDVVQAIKWARQENLQVSVRSGGHSYEGFSIADGGLVIDVSRMTKITVNSLKKTATVQSGSTLMPLYETLWERQLVVPGGSCATVGVAGLALGGGFGLLARHFGLTCDNLLGLRMVDAGGNVVEANDHHNQDLLWACRGGGGGSLGIVTEFTLQAHPINRVSVFKIKWNWNDMPAVINAWQKWAPNVDERMTSVLTMTSKKSNRVSCIGVFVGDENETRALMKPLIAAAKPLNVSLSNTPFIDAVHRFSGVKSEKPKTKTATAHASAQHAVKAPAVTTEHAPVPPVVSTRAKSPPVTPHPDVVHMHYHPRFKNTSDYVNKELDDDAIKTIVTHLTDSPRDSSCIQLDSYGGKINQVPIKDTAFCHRGDTKFCIHYQINWAHANEDERNMKWVCDFKKAMQPFVSGFSYFNYCDREIENWAHSYYGENLERLISVKKKYDPENFFRFAQSIPVDLKG